MKLSPIGTNRRSVTANYHFIRNCNYRCKYCYATFCDGDQSGVRVRDSDIHAVTRLLAQGFKKVTFVGGEPTLYPGLSDLLSIAKSEGALTNVVTNGSVLTHNWLMANRTKLDFLTLSIDSGVHATLSVIGRVTAKGESLPPERLVSLALAAKAAGIGVKVNTVVTRLNQTEDLSALILRIAPERWKILQAAPVEGQNDRLIGDLTPSPSEFAAYWQRAAASLIGSGIRIIPEAVDTIRGSYVMVDPNGRFFDSTTGKHRYSSPILIAGLETALSEISFDETKFIARGGTADFDNRHPVRQVLNTLGGVAGSGKSTVSKILSDRTGVPFASVGKFAPEVADRRERISAAPVSLTYLPIDVQNKALNLIEAIGMGTPCHNIPHAKRLAKSGQRDVISIKIGWGHRLVCREQPSGEVLPEWVGSHESYNKKYSKTVR